MVGEDPGPAKLDKARGFNIPEIDEDQLFDMILTKSGMKPKYSKTNSEESCDSGLTNSTINSFEESPRKKKKVKEEQKNENSKKDEKKVKSNPNFKKLEVSSRTDNSRNVKVDDEFVIKSKNNSSEKSDETEPTKTNKENNRTSDDKQKKRTDESSKLNNKSNKIKEKELIKTEVVESPSVNGQKYSKDLQGEILSWADKYKPQDIKSIIGQQEGNSNMNKLKKWLTNWYRNQQPEMRKKIPKPSPWAKNDDGAYYKAALLSGPPGVGKLVKMFFCVELKTNTYD